MLWHECRQTLTIEQTDQRRDRVARPPTSPMGSLDVRVAISHREQDLRALMQLPLIERRHRLEDVLHDLHPCLQLIVQTSDPDLASEWLGEVPGVEGVVAKRADGRYRPGRREWIKVKRRRTADRVVVGVGGDESAPMLVLALRHSDGELHLLGCLAMSSVILMGHCIHFALVFHSAPKREGREQVGPRWRVPSTNMKLPRQTAAVQPP
jgi:hypothetical protein